MISDYTLLRFLQHEKAIWRREYANNHSEYIQGILYAFSLFEEKIGEIGHKRREATIMYRYLAHGWTKGKLTRAALRAVKLINQGNAGKAKILLEKVANHGI
jgi:hypothetical protein